MYTKQLVLLLITSISFNLFGAAVSASEPLYVQFINALEKGPNDTQGVKRSLELVPLFVKYNAHIDKKYEGSTLLGWAALYGVHQVVESLCTSGADVNARMRSNSTALHSASSKGCAITVGILLKHGADPTLLTVAQQTPLHRALISKANEAAIRLINADAPLEAEDNFGNTPLSLAEENGMTDVAARIHTKFQTS